MTTVSIKNPMELQYFGDPTDSDISLADQLVKGVGLLDFTWKKQKLQSSVTSGPSRLYNHGGCGTRGEELLRSDNSR